MNWRCCCVLPSIQGEWGMNVGTVEDYTTICALPEDNFVAGCVLQDS